MEEKIHLASTLLCDAWGRTSIGGRKENQDSYGGLVLENMIILTVCDGMGGMAGGQTASLTAVKEILNTFNKPENRELPIDELLRCAINNANKSIYDIADENPALSGMGTTATVVVITPEAAYLTHVGDSRIYLLHGNRKLYRTFDHSRVFELVEQGYMTEEAARQSNFSNVITRAVGIRPSVDFTIEKIPYNKGDRFLLCCDGIWNILPEREMLSLFSSDLKAEKNIVTLTDKVDKYGQEHGNNHDNLTAIMADMKISSSFQYSLGHEFSMACKSFTEQLGKCFKKRKLYKMKCKN